jgi:hypothetical protein
MYVNPFLVNSLIVTYLTSSIEHFRFEDETLMRLQALIKHIGGDDCIDPSSDGTDDQLGAFMMFIIREALTFCGLLPDKKSVPEREYRLAQHKQGWYNSKVEYLNKVMSQLDE